MRVILAALLISFALPIAGFAEASGGYLHKDEAYLQARKAGTSLTVRNHGERFEVEKCFRVDARRVRCVLAIYGIPSSAPQVCRYTSYVSKDRRGGILARTRDQVCVALPLAGP